MQGRQDGPQGEVHGEVHRAHLGRVGQVNTNSGVAALVTEVAAEAEAVLRRIILAAFSNHAILGEERGYGAERRRAEGAEARWLVDPLGGTVNDAYGSPVFATSVGLEWRGERVVGAALDPARGELSTAVRGQGAQGHSDPHAERLAVWAEP